MSSSGFVHLHAHSHYSLLEALPKVEDLVAAAKADGQKALALTDNGTMYGVIDFYKECVKQEIKPIVGVDFFVSPRTRHDKEHRVDDRHSRLVLLAKDDVGYHNLIRLASRANLEGFYNRPRIDRELIAEYREGILAILPAFAGAHAQALKDGNPNRAEEILDWHQKTFGDDLYLEITRHPEILDHEKHTQEIIALARRKAIPLVAAHEVYYLKPDDAVARELVNCIRTGTSLNRDLVDNPHDFSFLSRERVGELFADVPEAIANTIKIAGTCTLTLTLGKGIFPVFPIPPDSTPDRELRMLTEAGIAMRGFDDTPELRTRMDYELGIIEKKGYASYFLIVADLLGYARTVGIFTNTRGSAAGSLVSYLCGITTVDPIKFNMPFERFLNPERPSAPDIDMDIADNRRDDLIDYARGKYGTDHVVQIGTFGTMMARAAVRDVARALGHSYSLGDAIAKMIPFGKQGFPVTIDSSLAEVPELKEAYERDPDAREVIDLARAVEGNVRHMGVHAAGVILAPGPVTDFAPVQLDPKGGKTITQYDMYSIADEYGGVGLLKFDFLGLTNLSVLADAVGRVKIRLNADVDLDRVPLDDKKVYEMLTRGETLGVFQMAGSGMTAYLKDLKPTVVHDLNAMVALYRPGPMAFIPDYIARKRNPALVKYLDPRMEAILKPTYGIIIYQDDVMMMAVQLAGYSWGEADKFRKAMGKKIPEEMAKQKERFITGCVERGMKQDATLELWHQIETFAAYGFNKAHAASYGNLAYKTAYMKANFPVDYMAAVLTADAGDVEKIAEIVAECKHMQLQVLPPDVNQSFGTFTVVTNTQTPAERTAQSEAPDASGVSRSASAREGALGQQAQTATPDASGAERSTTASATEQGRASRDLSQAVEPRGSAGPAGPDSDPVAHTHAESIRFGLYSIKNFGTGVADTIIKTRTEGGHFTDLADFLTRVPEKTLNKKSLESLIQSGALDHFGERGVLLANIELLLSFHREQTKAPSDQGSLFSMMAPQKATLTLAPAAPADPDQKLNWEKELLGIYVSGHPLDKHRSKLSNVKNSIKHAKEHLKGVETVIGGFIETAQHILTKKGEKMCFLKVADLTDSIEVVIFPRALKEYEKIVVAGECVLLKGKISERNGEPSFVAEKAKGL